MAKKSDVIPRGLFESNRSYQRKVRNACPGTARGAKAQAELDRMDRDDRKKTKDAQAKVKREKAAKERRDKERKERGAKKPVKSGWW